MDHRRGTTADRFCPEGRSVADEPAKDKAADDGRPPKEALRYDGKSFDQWRTMLLTELKPERRCEAIKALAAFGVKDYGPEAATAIVEAVRGYKITTILAPLNDAEKDDDGKVILSAVAGLKKIGMPALPVLVKALKQDSAEGRRFAVAALGEMGPDANSAIPQLATALEDESSPVSDAALRAGYQQIITEDDAKVAFLMKAINARATDVRSQAITWLGSEGKNAKPAIPKLLVAVKDKVFTVRWAALEALVAVEADRKVALATVTTALKDEEPNVRLAALKFVQYAGPEARDAVPALIEALKRQREMSVEVTEIAKTLAGIGPAAKEAVPALKATMKLPVPKPQEPATAVLVLPSPREPSPPLDPILQAIQAIEGKPQPK